MRGEGFPEPASLPGQLWWILIVGGRLFMHGTQRVVVVVAGYHPAKTEFSKSHQILAEIKLRFVFHYFGHT